MHIYVRISIDIFIHGYGVDSLSTPTSKCERIANAVQCYTYKGKTQRVWFYRCYGWKILSILPPGRKENLQGSSPPHNQSYSNTNIDRSVAISPSYFPCSMGAKIDEDDSFSMHIYFLFQFGEFVAYENDESITITKHNK